MSRSRHAARGFSALSRLGLGLLILAYLAAFTTSYATGLSKPFGYLGFAFRPAPLPDLGLAAILALSPMLWIPRRMEGPSSIVLWVLYLMVFIPAMTVPFLCGISQHAPYMEYAVTLALGFFLAGTVIAFGPTLDIGRNGAEHKIQWFLGGLMAVTLFSVFVIGGWRPDLSRIADVYGLREDYTVRASTNLRWISYLVSWQTNMTSPALVAYGLVCRRPLILLAGAAGELILFTITGLKGGPLSIFLLLGLYFIIRKTEGRQNGRPSPRSHCYLRVWPNSKLSAPSFS